MVAQPPSFDGFLRQRGYDPADSVGFLRRMFVDCWSQPSFRAFWRVWNPVYGYALFRLYLALGGQQRPRMASLVVFVACGALLHDLPMALATGQPFFSTTVAFLVYGAMVAWEPPVAQPRRRPVANNVARIVLGLAVGAAVQSLVLFSWPAP
jgi:hypothetical protein